MSPQRGLRSASGQQDSQLNVLLRWQLVTWPDADHTPRRIPKQILRSETTVLGKRRLNGRRKRHGNGNYGALPASLCEPMFEEDAIEAQFPGFVLDDDRTVDEHVKPEAEFLVNFEKRNR